MSERVARMPSVKAPMPLTKIEIALLQGLADGDSPRALAQKRGRSYLTIRNQLRNIREKLEAANTHRAVIMAWLAGWID